MLQVLRNTETLLRATFYVDEVATSASGAVTAYVYKDDGSLASSGAASLATTGVYTYELAPQTYLDVLSVEWVGSINGSSQTITTEVEVVDSYYASVSEIRALNSLSDTSKFPLATVIQARYEAERLFERYCNRNFVPRYRRVVLDGNGTSTMYLPDNDVRRLIRVKEDGSTISTADWNVYEDGKLYRPNDSFSVVGKQNIDITYEAGMKYVPGAIKRAFNIYVRYLLLESYSRLPDRALSVNADGLYVQMAQAGPNRPTGLPEVDAVLNQFKAPKASWVGGWQ